MEINNLMVEAIKIAPKDQWRGMAPATLVARMNDPKPIRSLGEDITSEIARTTTIAGHQRERDGDGTISPCWL